MSPLLSVLCSILPQLERNGLTNNSHKNPFVGEIFLIKLKYPGNNKKCVKIERRSGFHSFSIGTTKQGDWDSLFLVFCSWWFKMVMYMVIVSKQGS